MKKLTLAAVALLAIAGLAMAETFTINLAPSASDPGYTISGSGTGLNAVADSLTFGGNAAIQNSNASRFTVNNWVWSGNNTLSFDVTIADGYELTALSIGGSLIPYNNFAPGSVAWSVNGTQGTAYTLTRNGSNTVATDIADTIRGNWSGDVTISLQTLGNAQANGYVRESSWAANGAVGFVNTTTFTGTVQESSTPPVDVPEPATLSLLGLGAMAFVLRRKLRK